MRNQMYGMMMVAGLLSCPVVSHGQNMVLAAAERAGLGERVSLMQRETRTISVAFNDTPLSDAIRTVASESGLPIMFTSASIPAKRVTYKASSVEPRDVLVALLQGTDVVVQTTQSGAFKLVRLHDVAQGSVIGRVLHAKTRQPIVGATVTVDGVGKGVTTGQDGAFRITVPTGDHTVRVRGLGLIRQSRLVKVGDGEAITVEFLLDPTASVLDEVVVTGTVVATARKAIPTPITVITAADIEKRGITRIEEFFRGEVPGLVSVDAGAGRYQEGTGGASGQLGQMANSLMYARGGTSLEGGRTTNPIKTYIDGVELLDPNYLGTIDPQSIERIEIIVGPQAATIYGSGAMGGVMQIFTKRGSGQRAPDVRLHLRSGPVQSSFSSGLTPKHAHTVNITGGSGPEFSYAVSGSYNYLGQWQPYLFNRSWGASVGATHVRGPFTIAGAFSATGGTNGTSGYRNALHDGYGSTVQRAKEERGEWSLGNPAVFFNQRISGSASQTVSLNADYRVNPAWSHRVTVGRSQTAFDVVPESPALASASDTLFQAASSQGQRTTLGYSSTLSLRPMSPVALTMTLGANGSYGRTTTINACLTSTEATSYIGCFSSGPGVSRSLDRNSWGMFGSWQFGFFEQFFVTLGLRGQRNPAYGRNHKIDWTPTNGVTYAVEISDLTIKLLGSYGRSTRPPSPGLRDIRIQNSSSYIPSQFVSQLENPLLRPEYTRGPQGGLEMYWGNRMSLSVNHFNQKTTDLIQSVTADSLEVIIVSTGEPGWYRQNQYQNVASIRQRGWDATVGLNYGPVSLKSTYSWTESRVLAFLPIGFATWQNYGQTNILTDIPTHLGNVQLNYALGGTSITLNTNFVGKFLQTQDVPTSRESRAARLRMYVDKSTFPYSVWAKPGHAKSTLSATRQMTPRISLSLQVDNLGNRYDSDWGYLYPSLGRQTLFGAMIRFPGSR